jgi:hypothetical protein
VAKKVVDETLVQIEETQKALRRSIEQTKELAVQSEKLIRQHRNALDGSEKPSA